MAVPTMVDEEKFLDSNGKPYVMVKKFWSCPVKFIPGSVWSFLKYRAFHERHPSAPFPTLEKTSPRYLQAEAVYDIELSKLMVEGG